MSGLAGFDFQALNQKYMAQPANDAASYAASIMRVKSPNAWRCIGIYHLKPEENRGRHNVFIECLDENGNRLRYPIIGWTWVYGGPVQQKRLDKPANEPAADIPIDGQATITLWVADELESDVVTELYTRHKDEAPGNTWGHHSYYVVFQRQAGAIVTAPPIDPLPPVEPPKPLTLESLAAQVAELQAWRRTMEGEI
jgi:hypothetical protein